MDFILLCRKCLQICIELEISGVYFTNLQSSRKCSTEHTIVPFIPLKGLGECIAVVVGAHEGLRLHVGVGLHVGHLHRHLPLRALSLSTRLRSGSPVSNLDWHLVPLFLTLHVYWYNPKSMISKVLHKGLVKGRVLFKTSFIGFHLVTGPLLCLESLWTVDFLPPTCCPPLPSSPQLLLLLPCRLLLIPVF